MSTPNEGSDRIDYHETADITEVHAAVQREKPEPSADVTPIPLWLTGVCALATIWAGIYFGVFNGGLSGSVYNEYESSPPCSSRCRRRLGRKRRRGGAAADARSTGQDGLPGQVRIVPPALRPGLAGECATARPNPQWVLGSEKRLIAIVLKGAQGPITVHGTKNTLPRANDGCLGNAALSQKDCGCGELRSPGIWRTTLPEISEAKVVAAKKIFADQKVAWTEEQLLQIPDDALCLMTAVQGRRPRPLRLRPAPLLPLPGAAAAAATSPAAPGAPAAATVAAADLLWPA